MITPTRNSIEKSVKKHLRLLGRRCFCVHKKKKAGLRPDKQRKIILTRRGNRDKIKRLYIEVG